MGDLQEILALKDSNGKTHTFETEITVGRELGFSDPRMSRLHFRVFPKEKALYVEDLGSTAGTEVNADLIGKEQVKLRLNDVIRAGDTRFTLVLVPRSQAPDESAPRAAKKQKPRSWLMILILVSVLGTVGVAVLGIIAAIAIPNFVKFQSKARQTEAKSTLLLFSSAQQAFFAENQTYTSDLDPQNNVWPGEARLNYKYGFARSSELAPEVASRFAGKVDPRRKDSDVLNASYATGAPQIPFDELSAKYCPDCVATPQVFKILAVGNIDADPTFDVWTVNELNQLVHVVDDASN